MSEFTSPALVAPSPAASICTLLADRLARDPDGVLLERQTGLGGTWQPMTVAAFVTEVRALAKGLVASGVQPGDRVAIMSRTRYEWMLVDFAVWAAGAVGVPVYETSAAEQVRWIASDSGVRLAVVETAAHAAVVAQVRNDLPGLTEVLVLDEGAVGTLVERGTDVPDDEIDRRSALARGDDLATVIYTSGTTGRPKGVELTHGNFVELVRNGAVGLGDVVSKPTSRTLLFMPLAHVFARFIQVVCVESGAVLGHAPDTRNLMPDLASFKPTFLLAVPRVFEKVYNSAEQKAGAGTSLRIFRWAAKVAIAYSRALDTPGGPGAALRAQHRTAGALVHRKLRAALGGRAEFAVSGGAPLGERLGHFYRGIGLHVLEGYGLTETAAATAVNRPSLTKIGTVGPPMPGTTLRVDDDGQIWVAGPHVFRGYRHMPKETAEALVDGWFRTGDIGTLDDDGYLRITGRSKEIIVTAGGKNVAPALLEDRLRGHPVVSQVVVVGDQRPFIGALVTLDAEMLPGWLTMHGLPAMDVTTAARHPQVLEALDRAVERANEAVSRAESIRKIAVLTTDFTEANGYLTPSLKVKRAAVLQDFADEVDQLYVDTRAGH
ncbi:AMP-dependent synthetase/ligase [Cellulomonas wangsupingiae]|uniref:Acyl-CoA synthetase n=1 Tax=Cellulomonas wangsupingiae TaxID=2968085 RepID=A0ABY5KAL2_9CELL|nr:AMP-dependent synthetase/ligase [Cellulomonas wangsupingiae]MCC2334557.1 AMP-dependent synthetase/ligase [Cellulomonas wangsupingiae]UUI66476.1 AMP-dependent synthetase/ligase [Cellulomonas wangsupingiae]